MARLRDEPKSFSTVAENEYKATLKLPRTNFPMKANLPHREPDVLKKWDGMDLYRLLLEERRGARSWVLHDGPPYANGRVHFGTALNKILKDFILRSRSMLGYRTPFVPGWDCHGMPIEHRVIRELGDKAQTLSKLELRRLCRKSAEHWIDDQRRDFRRLGVIGDWENPYLTFTPDYDAAEIAALRQMVEHGYVYRGLRPVHWCFGCRTALAEAEVEYRDHRSPSIYVAFRINQRLADADGLAVRPEEGKRLAEAHRAGRLDAVIWTTTPWTLPANLAICLNAGFDYVAVRSGERWFVVASGLAQSFAQACGLPIEETVALDRAALQRHDGEPIFDHPLLERHSILMFAEHVTAASGTGLVHTAPGHGYEDFVAGTAYGLKALTPVDAEGRFTAEAGEWAGQNVFAANPAIVEKLRSVGALLYSETVDHSYPHCWRCKNPLIFRATEQWFMRVDHNGLRERALEEIDRVKWVPAWARDRIWNMVAARPDWCLSRQRVWGVPIPALKCQDCGRVELNVEVMRRVEEIFARDGSDAWYAKPATDFVPEGFRCAGCDSDRFVKEEDVLDVWFDSGCSQAAVLTTRAELGWPSDAYVEGIDQCRGWFQSSLIVACATKGKAPYRAVVSHGLALDELGRKMSKSLGNFEYSADVVERVGADVFRLLFASVDYAADMSVGEGLFGSIAEAYRKLRNTCRYLLGNLFDFDPAHDAVSPARMPEFDRFMLARAERLKAEVRRAYEEFDFKSVYHALVNFVVVDLSSLYIDVTRDRLYCDAADSLARRSAQTVFYELLDMLVRMLAPLIPYTAEEVYSHMPGERRASIHLLTFKPENAGLADRALEERWERLLRVRAEALKVLEAMRQAGAIGAPLEARLMLGARGGDGSSFAAELARHRDDLKALCIVSALDLLDENAARDAERAGAGQESFNIDGAFSRLSGEPPVLLVGRRAPGRKCARCWMYFEYLEEGELCSRCRSVVRP